MSTNDAPPVVSPLLAPRTALTRPRRGRGGVPLPIPPNWPPRPRTPPPTQPRAPNPPNPPPNSGPGNPDPSAPSPAPTAAFLALPDNDLFVPPNAEGAVGPSGILVTVNGTTATQNRDGSGTASVSSAAFWASVNAVSPYDPRCVYDAVNGRWLVSANDQDGTATATVLVGASTGASPAPGQYAMFAVPADPTGQNSADYDMLGHNALYVVISINLFQNSTGNFVGTQFYVLSKPALYAGTLTYQVIANTAAQGACWMPAIHLDTSAVATFYLIQKYNENIGALRIGSLTGAVGSVRFNPNASTSMPSGPPWSAEGVTTNGGFAPQLSTAARPTSDLIDTEDDRIMNALVRGGSLWCAHTIFYPSGGNPTRASVQWWQIAPASGAVVQRGVIDDLTNTTFFAYPTIAVNQSGDALVGFSRFSQLQYASANYALRRAADPASTLRVNLVYQSGVDIYEKTYGGGYVRWGDYSSTTVDPVDNTTFWTCQEFAATASPPGGRGDATQWGTYWAQVSPTGAATSPIPTPYDLLGSGQTSLAVWRTSLATELTRTWQVVNSSGTVTNVAKWGALNGSLGNTLGTNTQIEYPVPAHYGLPRPAACLVATWRPDTGFWEVFGNITSTPGGNALALQQWGTQGDWPTPGDFLGLGTDQYVVYRASGLTWYLRNVQTGASQTVVYGVAGGCPVFGDFFGVGRPAIGYWQPSNGTWFVMDVVSGATMSQQYGSAALGDVPVCGDYLGKGYVQFAVWRASNQYFFVWDQRAGTSTTFQFGAANDVPLEGDFDGDGVADFAMWRPSTGQIIYRASSTGTTTTVTAGSHGDWPIPGAQTLRRMDFLGVTHG